MTSVDQSHALLSAGRTGEAVAMLEQAGRGGDPAAWIELALWRLQGLGGPRDLVQCRSLFHKAADLRDMQARLIFLSLMAQGVGGPADWPRAITLLRELAADNPAAAIEAALIDRMKIGADGVPAAIPAPRTISDRPAVRLFPALITTDEANALISAATPLLSPSVVIDPTSGRAIPHPVRTSDNASFPYLSETPFIHALNRRFAVASGTSVEAGEPLQLLRYRPGQEYKPHFDALPATDNQRVLTMLITLNDDYDGGETAFLSTGLNVRGRIGDAVLFRNADDAGRPDPMSKHAGLPVTRGEKFIATRWIRQRQFGPR